LKDKDFRPSWVKTHHWRCGPKWDFDFDKTLSRPMALSSTTAHQATSERQIAVASLSLIRPDQPRNLMVAHPGSGPAFQFPSAVDVKEESLRGFARQRSAE